MDRMKRALYVQPPLASALDTVNTFHSFPGYHLIWTDLLTPCPLNPRKHPRRRTRMAIHLLPPLNLRPRKPTPYLAYLQAQARLLA